MLGFFPLTNSHIPTKARALVTKWKEIVIINLRLGVQIFAVFLATVCIRNANFPAVRHLCDRFLWISGDRIQMTAPFKKNIEKKEELKEEGRGGLGQQK